MEDLYILNIVSLSWFLQYTCSVKQMICLYSCTAPMVNQVFVIKDHQYWGIPLASLSTQDALVSDRLRSVIFSHRILEAKILDWVNCKNTTTKNIV